jgi:hypothetical protein
MSKELLLSERPADANLGGINDNIPKGSIGNYKGVMLCNRPNELGVAQKMERFLIPLFFLN